MVDGVCCFVVCFVTSGRNRGARVERQRDRRTRVRGGRAERSRDALPEHRKRDRLGRADQGRDRNGVRRGAPDGNRPCCRRDRHGEVAGGWSVLDGGPTRGGVVTLPDRSCAWMDSECAPSLAAVVSQAWTRSAASVGPRNDAWTCPSISNDAEAIHDGLLSCADPTTCTVPEEYRARRRRELHRGRRNVHHGERHAPGMRRVPARRRNHDCHVAGP